MPTRLHVLNVEDLPDDARLILRELSRGGYDVVSKRVDSAEDLRRALAESPWEIVLSDYSMPGFSAPEALFLCRESDPDLPFVVISGTIGEDRAVEMMRAGANDYLLKNSLARLVPVVERELREVSKRRLHRQTAQAASLLAAIVESSDDAIISKTMEGIVTSWNPAAERIFGWGVAEAMGRHISFVIPPDRADEFAGVMERLSLGEQIGQFETVRLRRDGTRFDVSITVSPIRDREGRLTGISMVARDISSRKRTERLMRKSEERYRRLFETAQDGVLILDAVSGQIADANPFLTKLLGYRHEELVGKELWEIGLLRDMASNKAAFRTLQDTGFFRYDNYPLQSKDGSQIEVEFVSNTYDVGDTRVVQCNIRDISERKLAEEALRWGEERLQKQSSILQLILDNMSDGVVVADEQGEILLFNPAAEQILNLGSIHVPPSEWSERYSLHLPDGTTMFPAADLPLIKAIQGEDSDEVEMIVNHTKVSQPRWISMNARPMRDENFVLRGGIVVFRNVTERKRTEQALRASEVRYRSLIAATAAIVWDSPASGQFDTEQPAWTAFTGQTLEQHRGWGWLDAIHPDDREMSAKAWKAAVAERGNFQVEHRLRRLDGEYRYMFVRAVPIFDSEGAIHEWVGVHTDVSDLKRVEIERAELLTQLKLQIERMPLAYILFNPDYCITDWNPAAERIFGFAREEALGLKAFDLVARSFHGEAAEILARIRTGDMAAHSVNENITKSGATILCEWHNTPLLNAEGKFHGMLSLAQDVTSRRWAEQAASDAQQRLKHVLASSPAVLFTLTVADNKILGIDWISDNIKALLGYAPEDALGQDWWTRNVHPEEREFFIARTNQDLFDLGYATHEYRFRHKSGQYVWTRSEVRLIRDAAGRPAEVVGSWSDITERKLLEDQFHQAQKLDAFGQLAAGVAHDFNNLLTIINGYSEMLIQSLPQGHPSRKMAGEILKAGERSAGLTRQLLAFSRQQILAPKILNLNEVVSETDKMLRRLIGEDVRLTTTLASNLWAVRADPGQVGQVLLNLAVNARDAMPTGGRLTIETQNVVLDESYTRDHADVRAGAYVLVSVADTGTGMTPEVQKRLFEPFFTTKEPGKGTGLGLATVYGIVKHSGGHVRVYSNVGIGTTFKIYLPRFEGVPEGLQAPSQFVIPPRGTETILLAEDEAGVRELTSQILAESGYKVLQASDGDEALRLAAAHDGPIQLLITDVVMPGMGGRSVAKQVTERHTGVRVLFMSGYTDDAVIRHGGLREGVDFIQKPFSPLAFLFKVREVLDAPAKSGVFDGSSRAIVRREI
jgi:PAS domain S-box-containing protein